jgi:hypothetical protein
MREIVEKYLKSPSKELYAQLTSMEQVYVDKLLAKKNQKPKGN